MKKNLFLLTFLLIIANISFAQNRHITSSATYGELYLSGSWYGIYDKNWGRPYYETLRNAIYRITENGKKLTKQYDANYFANPKITMQPNVILADATPGVIYNKDNYSKNSYPHTALWVSFDYGKNWVFREENIGAKSYYVANVKGIIYRNEGEISKSSDYGYTWNMLKEQGFPTRSENFYEVSEFYCISGSDIYYLYHTYDYFKNFTTLIMDSEYVFGQICGIFPDVYRGGLPGEVYISSLFPDGSYKVSFSADTGHTFRHVYVDNDVDCTKDGFPVFMSDREPGVFYIVRSYSIEDKDPYGWHTKVCIEYYRDYGEILVNTYCHDITKDYNNDVGIKEKAEGRKQKVEVYPNPAFSTVTIESEKFRKVEIYNAVGQLLKTVTTDIVDVTPYASGVYFFKVFDMENNSITKRVVVVR